MARFLAPDAARRRTLAAGLALLGRVLARLVAVVSALAASAILLFNSGAYPTMAERWQTGGLLAVIALLALGADHWLARLASPPRPGAGGDE